MMKKVISLALSVLLLAVFILAPGNVIARSKDLKAPVVHANTIKVNKKTIESTDEVTISMKISDDSEMSLPVLWIVGAGEYNEHAFGIYNESTGLWDFTITSKYFGLIEIQSIWVMDAYSNVKTYYNDASKRVPKYFADSHSEYVDLSGGNFTVSQGSYAKETKAPRALLNTVTVSKTKPNLKEDVYFKVKINDDSPIANTYFDYAYSAASLRTYGSYNPTSGYYEYPVTCSNYGKYEPLQLVAEDAFGNKVTYIDKSQSFMEKYTEYKSLDGISARLSGGNFTVQGGKKDITPPVLDPSSFNVEKRYLKRGEQTIISFKAKDNTGIDCYNTDIWYAGYGEPCATSCTYNAKTGRYEVIASGDCYGTHQIYEIRLVDNYGNQVYYSDENSEMFKAYGYIPEQGTQKADLSRSTFYVGIENKKTGTFVSNSTMDDSSRLNVTVLDENEKEYAALKRNGYNSKGLYEVKVKGRCDMSSEDTKVFFDAPEGFLNGDKLQIRHLLSNGTVQTENSVVISGKIGLDVNEFSPFMILAKKASDKNLFTQKNLIYQVTGKNTVKLVKPSKKTLKTLVIPATIKANKKTYKVTEIAANAFKNCKKLKSVTIGKNIKKIGAQAFYKCKKVKTLKIQTTSLTSKRIGKNAFRGISKKAKLKLPMSKKKAYKKLLKKKGLGKK